MCEEGEGKDVMGETGGKGMIGCWVLYKKLTLAF